MPCLDSEYYFADLSDEYSNWKNHVVFKISLKKRNIFKHYILLTEYATNSNYPKSINILISIPIFVAD